MTQPANQQGTSKPPTGQKLTSTKQNRNNKNRLATHKVSCVAHISGKLPVSHSVTQLSDLAVARRSKEKAKEGAPLSR